MTIQSITNQLTDKEVARILKAFTPENVNLFNTKHQPLFNSSVLELSDLLSIDKEFDQYPVNPRKVRDILFKADSGLVPTKMLFTPITISYSKDTSYHVLASGRHRVSALLTIVEVLKMYPQDVPVAVLELTYPSEEHITGSIVAHNCNRTMTSIERKNVILNGKLGTPINSAESAQSYAAKSVTKFKEALKHYTVNYIREIQDTDPDTSSNIEITLDTLSTIMGRVGLDLVGKMNRDVKWVNVVNTFRGDTQSWDEYTDFLINEVELGWLKHNGKNIKRTSIQTYAEQFLFDFESFILNSEVDNLVQQEQEEFEDSHVETEYEEGTDKGNLIEETDNDRDFEAEF